MAVTDVASSVDNYYKGQGIVSARLLGAATEYRDMGNVPEFEFTPEIETNEHMSSRTGVRSVDKRFIVSQTGTLRIVMEEFTASNVALMVLGTLGTPVAGMIPIEIFDNTELTASIRFVGTNLQGAKMVADFYRVTFNPTSTLALISSGDDLDQMELEGAVTRDATLGFGMIYWNIGDTVPAEPANVQ